MKSNNRIEHWKKPYEEVWPRRTDVFKRRSTHGKIVEVIGSKNMTIKCNRCRLEQSQAEYHLTQVNIHGQRNLKRVCRTCANKGRRVTRKAHREKIYPHPKPEGCDICGFKTSYLVLDHDHITGQPRGWLCRDHNTGMGKCGVGFKTEFEGVKATEAYLKRFENEA